ncbi:hypothetical protein EJB05_05027 [Eragrostis curvula]|uniref:Bifunctional inhibitor/plant lipid transfer protein/seed storage helical domain-containing protein n=1 Tax=Eragrostis curvula TaxID=38414 RepID=A0A5J9WBI0_9POAL|nr:hypothetical protein EJB05_05007 [Eragrostis curvula]TVU45538.1 hypothetical protein EJB05_05027 [Eragrostis curvula]
MAKLSCLLLCLAFVAMATAGAHADGECDDDVDKGLVKDLVDQCKQFVMFPENPKIAPSDGCCGVVQKLGDYKCLCKKVTKELEKIVCMEKVVYVAGYCKRPMKPGPCGSYTVPGGQ